MTQSCLLCLNSIKDKSDSIETNTTLWQELDIRKKLEKHFWSLSTIKANSSICLPCWQEVDDFNTFYLRIEEAHTQFYKVKPENVFDCKQETKLINNDGDSNNVKQTFDSELPRVQADQQVFIISDGITDTEIAITTTADDIDLDDVPLSQTCKRQKSQTVVSEKRQKAENCLTDKDHLWKDKNNYNCKQEDEVGKPFTEEFAANEFMVKEETQDISENDLDSVYSDGDDTLGEIETDDVPLNQTGKRQTTEICVGGKRQKAKNYLVNRDTLTKSNNLSVTNITRNKSSKGRDKEESLLSDEFAANELIIKEEPLDLSENDSDSVSDNDNQKTDANYVPIEDDTSTVKSKKRKYNGKHRMKSEDMDKFIAEHFKDMSCDICKSPLQDFSDMHKHFSGVHEQRGYLVCCFRKYFDRHRLIDHLHSHLNPDHFKCHQCGRVLSDRLNLETHIRCVHDSSETMKKHNCDVCGKSFSAGRYLRTHKLSHLPEEEKKFLCEECGKSYSSSRLLHQHVNAVHLKKFLKVCEICGKHLWRKSAYEMHMNEHEGKPQPTINCDVCGVRLNTETGLRRHKDSQHPVDGRKRDCPECQKVFPTLHALRMHIYRVHNKSYDHKCTICAKAFKTTKYLREHMASHNGTPLYKCPWCPKTFSYNANMHAHRKKMHPKEWEEARVQKYSETTKSNTKQ